MTQPKPTTWPQRLLDLAQTVSTWSKDPSTGVGAVIADSRNRIVGIGYNGLPHGVTDSSERLKNREVKLALTLHAEENAVLNSTKSVDGCSIYVTKPPCSHCASIIIQVGITNVYYYRPPSEFETRWAESIRLANSVFDEARVQVHIL